MLTVCNPYRSINIQNLTSANKKYIQPDSLNHQPQKSFTTTNTPKFSGIDEWADDENFRGEARAVNCRAVKDDNGNQIGGSVNYKRGEIFNKRDFSRAYLKHCIISGCTFPFATNFRESVAERADFAYSTMHAADFEDSVLVGADFGGANLQGANFNGCEMGWIATKEELDAAYERKGKKSITPGRLLKSFFSLFDEDKKEISPPMRSCFRGANLAGAHFQNANLLAADFQSATLSSTDFTNADLRYANFAKARILGAIFKGALLENAYINLEEAFEKEVTDGKDSVVTIIKLGELMRATGLKLGIQDPNTARHINELLNARDRGRISSHQLESTLRKHFTTVYKPVGFNNQKPSLETVFPKVFAQTYKELL